ncbi:periplasmic heavy metal sensor [Pseudohalocynthiibacter aestuariivivens]|nr:periplasmic heavy metal sensor [Pseudohalocynthiibacter aestuariivivens]QIE45277.1 periplasmic heavy metal sensor [Pseudohalocynthiibacter aestuariivivens]
MAEEQHVRPRMSGRLRLLLTLSLGLNLLVVGVVAGAAINTHKWRDHGGRHEMMGGPLTRALSDEDRRAIGRAMRAARPDKSETRAERGAAMTALLSELRRVPFDPVALAAKMEASHAKMRDRVAQGQALLLDRLTAMTDEERAAYADRVETHRRHRR